VTALVTICEWMISDEDVCGQPSRFLVERDDPSYPPWESCEAHLADTIANLLEGKDIKATVTVHWDEEEP
jgi:hypothetical protein